MKRNPFAALAVSVAAGACLALAAGLPVSAAEPAKGLVLHFNFDQDSGAGVVADRSGQNNNGQAAGAKWAAAGKQGGCCNLASAGAHIRVANTASLGLKQATLAAWFKTSTADAKWQRILAKGGQRGCALSIGGDAKDLLSRGKLAFAIDGGAPCLSDTIVADGVWHHAAATFDGENLRLYVDGLPQKQVIPCRADIAAHAEDLVIGMDDPKAATQEKGPSFDGLVDDVMVFNRALSADEIKALVTSVDPAAVKPKFTKQQVANRLRQLKALFSDGLLTQEFYDRKVKECEALQ